MHSDTFLQECLGALVDRRKRIAERLARMTANQMPLVIISGGVVMFGSCGHWERKKCVLVSET